MTISEERQPIAPENSSPQEQFEASKPPRYSNWISYAVAVTQQVQAHDTDYSSDSKF